MIEAVFAATSTVVAAPPAPDEAFVGTTGFILYVISWVAIVSGAFFVLVGAIGLIRMPDVFTRKHAASVIDTVGAGLLISGMMLQAGWSIVTLKLAFIFFLLLMTSPVATHALAQAALAAGVSPELKEDRTAEPAEKRGDA